MYRRSLNLTKIMARLQNHPTCPVGHITGFQFYNLKMIYCPLGDLHNILEHVWLEISIHASLWFV